MAFKKISPPTQTPDSPDELFRELPSRKIPDVLPHQREIMRNYASQAVSLPDVALQLPTGSGKTLVGLLIAEWRRRRNRERIVYLCPTRQLVNQVVEQAKEKYGLTVLGFTGKKHEYEPTAKAEYRNADRIAITTYSSLFNTSPFFNDANVIIADDSHAAESYVSAFWSLRVERNNQEHAALHSALCGIVKPLLDPSDFARLSSHWTYTDTDDSALVDKISTPDFSKIANDVEEVLDVHTQGTNLAYTWSMIRKNLQACHLYFSSQEFLIRPLIPPTWTHKPFYNAKQRIYMSATLGDGGDLERLMGRKSICRLCIPQGWDSQGVGRRFFIFPGMSLDTERMIELRRALMRRTNRSLVLVPNDHMSAEIDKDVKDNLSFQTFGAHEIEISKSPFISADQAVAIIANRYDGIDFPGEECRLMFIQGLPKATNLQERFLMVRMGANVLFNERVQTRVLQAIGRCTRSLEDYSAVVVSGENLTAYLVDIEKRKFLHPELQAEIQFGVEQSKGVSLNDLVENFDIFLKNDEEWEQANQGIVSYRRSAVQEVFPAMKELTDTVSHEIDYQIKLWQGDYEAALDHAGSVLGKLNASELRGYRALWHYLAGSAAWLGANAGISELHKKARAEFACAKDATLNIRWLIGLARDQTVVDTSIEDNTVLIEQIERVEMILAQLETVHDRKFTKREKEILDGLASTENHLFEHAHKLLGDLIGFKSDNAETDGSPDPWWIAGKVCFVFEDHSGAQDESSLAVKKARQVASHPAWIRNKVPTSPDTDILPVLITPVRKATEGAVVHLQDVSLWSLEEFREWATKAITVIRNLRSTFVEPGDLKWRELAAELFKKNELDGPGLYAKLRTQRAVDYLEIGK